MVYVLYSGFSYGQGSGQKEVCRVVYLLFGWFSWDWVNSDIVVSLENNDSELLSGVLIYICFEIKL